jgi:tRNA 2-thiocytidine biosynthesis protein TtcA
MHLKRLEQRILKAVNRANRDFGLIGEGDRILVALSGGKDSWGMLWALRKLQAAAPFDFDLFAFHLDQGQPGHNDATLEAYLQQEAMPYEIERQNTYTRVIERTEPGKVFCVWCARFRRAILYKAATRHGCNKVALGHHRDDTIETLLLNILFSGQIKAMPPRLVADDKAHEVIRPLIYVPEQELVELSQQKQFPLLPCSLCGSQDAQRKYVKRLLDQLSADSRHVRGNLLAALGQVYPSHLFDKRLNPLYKSSSGPIDPGIDDESHSDPSEENDGAGSGR